MKNFLQKWLGITKLWRAVNHAMNRIRRLENMTRLGRKSQRYDQIERARKNRYKNWPKKRERAA